MSNAPVATEWTRDGFIISTDRIRLDVDMTHTFLTEASYWAKGVPRDVVERSIENSLTFGIYVEETGAQIGFARVITDKATFAYLADVFVLPEYRGQGLSKWLMEIILAHPELQGLRRFMLITQDAHGLYDRYGFTPATNVQNILQRHNPNAYKAE